MDWRPESESLIPTPPGTKVAMPHLRRSAERSARKAGIDEVDTVRPHTPHHTYTTGLYQDTCKIRMVQETLGHPDLSTRLKYSRVADEEIEGTIEVP